ncbi:DUF262 domain-containing protein [Peptococcaceae bacterium]|nr:DUF262 domain-containing protein [Peptococcaceae bacterium]
MRWESYAHPISDVRDWSRNNRLELRPDFQRNEVWTKPAQIMLIDTILRNIPIPKIYIKSTIKDGDTYRIVIDGQQRLTAILRFVQNDLALNKPYEGKYAGYKFNDLPAEIQNIVLRYKIDINEIFNPTDEEIRDLYARVNKYTIQLNKQELRKADFPGDFIKKSEKLSELPFFTKAKIFTVKQRRRMLDVEYIEELLAVVIEGIQDKKNSLNEFCEKYMVMEKEKEGYINSFLNVIEDIEVIFDNDDFPIHETRFNQKADFYSLFSCINQIHKENMVIDTSKIDLVRKSLKIIDEKVAPHSEEEIYREYAMRCMGDANSINSRRWREQYLKNYILQAYSVNEV